MRKRGRKTTTRLLAASLVLAGAILYSGCGASPDLQEIGPIPSAMDQKLFVLLKHNRVDDIVNLLPSANGLYFIAWRANFSYPSGVLVPRPWLPRQLSKDLSTIPITREYSEDDAKQTAATMRKVLRKNLEVVMKTCKERGLCWEKAKLTKASFRAGPPAISGPINLQDLKSELTAAYLPPRGFWSSAEPYKLGITDGYLLLTVGDGSVNVDIRFRLLFSLDNLKVQESDNVGAPLSIEISSGIDSGVFVETLSKDEYNTLLDLTLWMFSAEGMVRKCQDPVPGLTLLLRHKFLKGALEDWFDMVPIEGSRNKWTCRKLGPDKKSVLEIHFGKDDRVSAVFLDGKPIKADSK